MRALIFSSVYISLAAALLTQGTYRLFATTAPSFGLTALVFFATLTIYNLDRLVGGRREDAVASTERHIWVQQRQRLLQILIGIGGAGVLLSLLFLQTTTLAVLIPLGLISLGYSLPVLIKPGTKKTDRRWRLKEIPAIKTASIALVWAAATVILPALEASQPIFDTRLVIIFVERFLFVFALTLPFDIRDRDRDRATDIKTLAVLLGPTRTIALAMALVAIFTASTASRIAMTMDPALIALSATGVLTLAALIPAYLYSTNSSESSTPNELSELYYGGLLDGMLVIQGILLILL